MYLHYIILAALILCLVIICIAKAFSERVSCRRKRPIPKPPKKPRSNVVTKLSDEQLVRLLSLRCPHCRNLLTASYIYDGTGDVPKKGHHIYCRRCGFAFPMAGTEEEAIACAEEICRNWNRTDGYNPIFSCIDHGDSVTMIYNGKEDAANICPGGHIWNDSSPDALRICTRCGKTLKPNEPEKDLNEY